MNICEDAYLAQKGMKHSEETRAKLRKAMAVRIADPSYGVNHSEKMKVIYSQPGVRQEQSDRIKQAWINPTTRINLLKANHAKRRSVIIDGIEYESAQHAADALGVTLSCVRGRLNSRLMPSWRYKNDRH